MTTPTLPTKARNLAEFALGFGSELAIFDNEDRAESAGWTNFQTLEVWNKELKDCGDVETFNCLEHCSKDEVYSSIEEYAGLFKTAALKYSQLIKAGLIHQSLNGVITGTDHNLLDMEQIAEIGLKLEADNKKPHFEESGDKSYF